MNKALVDNEITQTSTSRNDPSTSFITEQKTENDYIKKEGNFKDIALISDKYILKISHDFLTIEPSKVQNEKLEELIAQMYEAIEFESYYLKDDGIAPPKDEVINSTTFLLNQLASEDIFPNKIATTVEEGLYLVFENFPFKFYLEIYNNGDIAYIIEDTKSDKIIELKDLYSISEVKNRISQFYW